jgi:hypothetical protein
VLAVVLLFAAGVRARLLDVPLERDEGEYAYMAQLILDGVPPYTQAFNMKLPGIYAAYAVVLGIFGQTDSGIHHGLLLINSVTIVLLFLLARTWLDPPAALAAAASFALLSMGQSVQGVFANAEHFVLPFAIGGLWVLRRRPLNGARPRSLFLAGLLLGAGVLMKQHGAAFAAFGVLLVLAPHAVWRVRLRRASIVVAGVFAPYVVTCLILAATGAFGAFWFWTMEYARAYSSQLPFAAAPVMFRASAAGIAAASPLVWMLAATGFVALRIDPRLRPQTGGVVAFAAISFLAICPGFFFRPHYFVLTLPAASLLVGATVQAAGSLVARRGSVFAAHAVAALLVIVAAGDALVRQGDFLLRMSPLEASRDTYGANPFPESIEIARYIRENSEPGERIAVLGSEPQIPFYAQRRLVSGHIYTYAMMEQHEHALRMQQEMIADIESARPRFIVFVQVSTSWLQRPGSHTEIFRWFAPYSERNYRVVGLAEIVAGGSTLYHWGDDVNWPPATRQWVALMERRT